MVDSVSDEALEVQYDLISAKMLKTKKEWFLCYDESISTCIDDMNLEDFKKMDDATRLATYGLDQYLKMNSAVFCLSQLQHLNNMMYILSRSRPRFLSYDEATKKHIWDREHLYED